MLKKLVPLQSQQNRLLIKHKIQNFQERYLENSKRSCHKILQCTYWHCFKHLSKVFAKSWGEFSVSVNNRYSYSFSSKYFRNIWNLLHNHEIQVPSSCYFSFIYLYIFSCKYQNNIVHVRIQSMY